MGKYSIVQKFATEANFGEIDGFSGLFDKYSSLFQRTAATSSLILKPELSSKNHESKSQKSRIVCINFAQYFT